MAKKNKNEAVDGEEKGGSKLLSAIIVMLIILVWLVILCLLVKFDVGNFGSKVLRPVLKDVPVINKILPSASEDELVGESDYNYSTLSQALARIKELETENVNYATQVEELNTTVSNQTAFQQSKDNFYNEIVYGENAPSADTYIEWYNQIDQESAERIYSEIMENKKANSEIKELADSYAAMKPAQAADILEKMDNDLDTVASILNSMSAEDRGDILGSMNAQFAASVTKKLLP